jgi:hypothetical protein
MVTMRRLDSPERAVELMRVVVSFKVKRWAMS